MKNHHAYIIVVIIIFIITGVALWSKDITQETSDDTTTNIPGGRVDNSRPTNTPTQDRVPVVPTETKLNGSIFKLTSYNGVALPPDSKYILSFQDTNLSAKFCNSMSGTFVLDGNLIKANNLVSTLMYCATPTNLMEIETAFTSMLNFGATIYQSGNTVILSDASKGIVMVFSGF